jgi:hypothetical protein
VSTKLGEDQTAQHTKSEINNRYQESRTKSKTGWLHYLNKYSALAEPIALEAPVAVTRVRSLITPVPDNE